MLARVDGPANGAAAREAPASRGPEPPAIPAIVDRVGLVIREYEKTNESTAWLKCRIPTLMYLESEVSRLSSRFRRLCRSTSAREVPAPDGSDDDDLQARFDNIIAELEELQVTDSPAAVNDKVVALRVLKNTVEGRAAVLLRSLVSTVYEALSARNRAQSQALSINRRESRRRAAGYLDDIEKQVKLLDPVALLALHDVLAPPLQQAVGSMQQIAEDLENLLPIVDEELAEVRRTERRIVLFTMAVLLGCVGTLVLATIFGWAKMGLAGANMDELALPVLGVPWPVVVWGLIGGVAATIHRYNRHPSYDFNDAVKWIVTRPIQGAFLGAAAYLVFHSGLAVLTGGNVASAGATPMSNTVILVASFLVGFSDRVSDGIFNTLVWRYPDTSGSLGGSAEHPTA
jgi:hypothetical protein